MLIELAGACLLLALPAAPGTQAQAASAAARPVVVRADKLLLGDGTTLDAAAILIEGGRIQSFGKQVDVPQGAGVVEHRGWASAGLVALHGFAGAAGETRDSTRPVLDARVAWAFDPAHPDFADALAAGITTLVLTPEAQSLSGGTSAVVKSSGGRVLKAEAQLSLGFSSAALSINRFPTSYASAEAELDARFEKPVGSFARAQRGELPVLMETDTRPDVLRALEFAKRHKLRGAIYGADWAGELAEPVREAGLGVIFAPFDVGTERRTLRSALAIAKAGVPFGFGLDSPWKNPELLRLSAALCRREGLDAKLAWQALSSQAAMLAGVADRVGRIEKGLDADLVLWSGDPLDLTSRVEAVYVDGRVAYEAKKP